MKSFLANVRYTVIPVSSGLIPSLPARQKQQILWIGCSDSQITETDVLDVSRQEFFIHRNLGNKLSNGDTSSLSAIEFCVRDIQVGHVIICGHYGCGLINTSGDVSPAQSWLTGLNELREASEHLFTEDVGVEEHDRRLVELNVLVQVHWIMQQPSVIKAIRERNMKVHGFVYNPVRKSCVRLEVTSPAFIKQVE